MELIDKKIEGDYSFAILKDEINKTILVTYHPELNRLKNKVEKIEESLNEIIRWEDAYPVDMFPEEDIEKAREILKENGISLTNLMVHSMRHVVTRCAEIARKAME
jgi:UDP-N-acetylglucosamine 2-epimerase